MTFKNPLIFNGLQKPINREIDGHLFGKYIMKILMPIKYIFNGGPTLMATDFHDPLSLGNSFHFLELIPLLDLPSFRE